MGDAVPIFGILAVFGLPIVYAIISRVLSYNERVEMIRRGVMPPPDPKVFRRMSRAGWYDPSMYGQAPQAGAPGPAPVPPPYMQYDAYAASCQQPQRQLRSGIIVSMIGLAITIGLSFIGYHTGPLGVPIIVPGAWLLGGLVPLFVGIAQILIALLGGARFGVPVGLPPPAGPNAGRNQNFGGAYQQTPPPPFGSAPGPSPSGGPYGWRPGPTTELERPVRPPDIKS